MSSLLQFRGAADGGSVAGTLRHRGGSTAYFAIRNSTLSYWGSESERLSSPDGGIDLSKALTLCEALPVDPKDPAASAFGFAIMNNDVLLDLQAETAADRERWVEALRPLMTAALPTMRPRLISAAEVQGRVLKSWSTKWCIVSEDAMFYFEREFDMDRFAAIAPCRLDTIPELLLSTAAAHLSLRPSVARKVGAYDGHDFTLCVTEADGSENFLSVESVVHMDHWMPALTAAAGGAAVANKRGSVADLAYRNELEFEKAGHLIKKGGSVKTLKRRYFLLRKKALMYFEGENAAIDSSLGKIVLSAALSVVKAPIDPDEPMSKYGFMVLDKERVWELYAADETERDEWMQALIPCVENPQPPMQPRLISAAVVQVSGEWINQWCVLGDDVMYCFEKEYTMDWFIALAPDRLALVPAPLLQYAARHIKLRPCEVNKVGFYEGKDFTLCITSVTGLLGTKAQHYVSVESDLHMEHWLRAITAAAGESAVKIKRGSVLDLANQSMGAGGKDPLEIEKVGFLIKMGGKVRSLKRRFFVLRKKCFYYFENSEADISESLGSIELTKAISIAPMPLDPAEPASKYGFMVMEKERIWEIFAADDAERTSWVDALSPFVAANRIQPFKLRVQGWGTKQGGSIFTNWQRRWFVIGDDVLAYFESEIDGRRFSALAPRELKDVPEVLRQTASGYLPLRGNRVKKLGAYDGQPFCVSIDTYGGRTFYMSPDTVTDMNAWFDAVQNAQVKLS